MEEGNLPIEIAQEPSEEAHLSQGDEAKNLPPMPPVKKPQRGITFAEATQSTENSQASASTYKDVLSQPASGLSHRQRLLWLQKRRTPGLWVQCDDCDRWRFLADVIDANELPAKWRCKNNPDKSAADCSVPEAPLRLRDEEDLIHGQYSAGSVVWARLPGWPWWPAMVDDCPDTEQYYWLDGFSDIPTHYNVVFFDAFDVTRAWISPGNLLPYTENKRKVKISKDKRFRKRLEVAMTQADDADKLSLEKRLSKYSFITRYPGNINQPRKVNKHELKKFQKKLKRKYNIDFPLESESDEDEPLSRNQTTTVVQKKKNLLLVGTQKSKPEEKKPRMDDSTENAIKEELLKESVTQVTQESLSSPKVAEELKENSNNDTEVFKQPDSLMAQVGSNVTSTVADVTFDNDTSATYNPGSESENESIRETAKQIGERASRMSTCSDDFDF